MHKSTYRIPEMKTSPPEPDLDLFARNLRNSMRESILRAISTIEDRLEELDEITRERCQWLTALRNEIAQGMED